MQKELHDASYEEHLNIWLISCLRGNNDDNIYTGR